MSAFSRGFFLRPQCLTTTHIFLPSTRISTRHLTTSSILRAVTRTVPKAALKRTVPKNASLKHTQITPTNQATPPSAIYQTYSSRLAQRTHPTLLYLAPAHTGFIVCSYIMAGFCFVFAISYFWSNYLNAPDDLSTWVPIAFGGVCFFMTAAGGYFVLGPAWIVKSITAMPASALKAAGVVGKAAGAEKMKIEIEFRKMLPMPFFPARKVYVRPEEIRLKHVLSRPPPSKQSAVEIRALRAREEAETAKALEYERSHIMSRPIRHMSRAFFGLFQAARRTWTREGFTGIYIKNYRYKLDVSGGWALDQGRALDRLITIRREA